MTVKELITMLLECDMNKEVSLEYPILLFQTERGKMVGNYYRYEEAEQFEIKEYEHGVIIGVEDDN